MPGKRTEGYITVFMALSITIILSVLLSGIESARINSIKLFEQSACELAVESVMAEYNIPLYEQYGIFAIDGEGRDLSEDLLTYAKANETNGFFRFEVRAAYAAECVPLTDMNSKPLEKEILQYMTVSLGKNLIEDLRKKTDTQQLLEAEKSKSSLSDEITESKVQAEAEREKIEADGTAGDDGQTEEENAGEKVKDPRKSLMDLLKDGLLKLVIPPSMEISENSLEETINAVTEETVCKEVKDFEDSHEVTEFLDSMQLGKESETVTEKLVSELIINQYMLTHFKQAVLPKNDYPCGTYTTKLQYENEYLICGHEKDRDNLLDTLNRILLIRTAFNTAYLLTDAGKISQAHSISSALTILLPFLEPVVYTLIIAAWAYAEGIMDIKTLMNGGKVALTKNMSNWKLSLAALSSGTLTAEVTDKNGLSYEDYLRILLMLTNKEKKLQRMENLLQANIRLLAGYEQFNLKQCYYGITAYFECALPALFGTYTGRYGNYISNYQWSECY